jgi:hypothetical protein
MNLSNAMFHNIAKQIESGRAITAIATANRYLKKNCPLRLALVKKATNSLPEIGPLGQKILNAEELSRDLFAQAIIETTSAKSLQEKVRAIPTDFSAQISRCRLARRKSRSRLGITTKLLKAEPSRMRNVDSRCNLSTSPFESISHPQLLSDF